MIERIFMTLLYFGLIIIGKVRDECIKFREWFTMMSNKEDVE